jgi:hypothetical protein
MLVDHPVFRFRLPLPSSLLGIIVACLPLLAAASQQPIDNADERAAVAAAKEWLSMIDAANYRVCWQRTHPSFREDISAENWAWAINQVRKPLGEVVSRELKQAKFTRDLPDAPSGEYVLIEFSTEFAGKPDRTETIVPVKAGKQWVISGYVIR